MLPAGPWSQQRQWASGASQDALIAGNNEVGLGKHGAGQHPFIVRSDLGGWQLAHAAEHVAQHQPQ